MTVISGTEAANQFYSGMVPSNLIFEEFDAMIVARIIKRQRELKIRQQEERKRSGRSAIDCRCAFILDDCL